MQRFREWLLGEQRQDLVPQEVRAGYERGFRQALKQLLGKVQDPALQAKFQQMLDCPIKDAQGRCSSFTDYILGALVRHGIHRQADLEDVLSYMYQTMMHDKKVTGDPKATVFGSFNANRSYGAEGNPLEARFKVAVGNAIRNIASGRIPRLLNTQRQPQGTVSIGQGRGNIPGTVSPDEIPARADRYGELAEMAADIRTLLRPKEAIYGLPLIALFDVIMSGERTAEQRRRFGERAATMGRQVIVQTVKAYAQSSGNHYLLQLLQKLENPNDTVVVPVPKAVLQAPRPIYASLKDKDYASIVSVMDRLGRPAGTADLGRYRRRWLDYPPRDTTSGQPNRMAEVLAQMVRDGVLRTVPTGRGAMAYSPGPNAEQYRQGIAV